MTPAQDLQDIIDELKLRLLDTHEDEEVLEDLILYYKQLLDSLPQPEESSDCY